MFPQLGLIWKSNTNISKNPTFLINVNRITHCSSTHNKAASLIHKNIFGWIQPTFTVLQNRGKTQHEVKRDCYRYMLACLLRPTAHLSKQHRRILFKFTRWPRLELRPSQASWYQSQKQIKGHGTTWRWEQRGENIHPWCLQHFRASKKNSKNSSEGRQLCWFIWLPSVLYANMRALSCGHILFLLAVLNWIYFPIRLLLVKFSRTNNKGTDAKQSPKGRWT